MKNLFYLKVLCVYYSIGISKQLNFMCTFDWLGRMCTYTYPAFYIVGTNIIHLLLRSVWDKSLIIKFPLSKHVITCAAIVLLQNLKLFYNFVRFVEEEVEKMVQCL